VYAPLLPVADPLGLADSTASEASPAALEATPAAEDATACTELAAAVAEDVAPDPHAARDRAATPVRASEARVVRDVMRILRGVAGRVPFDDLSVAEQRTAASV
jgi:hypothetical protein